MKIPWKTSVTSWLATKKPLGSNRAPAISTTTTPSLLPQQPTHQQMEQQKQTQRSRGGRRPSVATAAAAATGVAAAGGSSRNRRRAERDLVMAPAPEKRPSRKGKGKVRDKDRMAAKLPDLAQRAFPEPPEEPYDIVVLGSGPGGESAAVHASHYGARVAVVEIKSSFGGPTGLTSKAVREAAKIISKTIDQVGGDERRQIRRLWKLRFPALRTEAEVMQAAETRGRLAKNQCDLYIGAAELVKPADATVKAPPGGAVVRVCRARECIELAAKHVVVATGSRPNRPDKTRSGLELPWAKGKLVDASEVAKIVDLPNAVAIIGGGVIAVEYATVFAKLKVGVTLLCPKDQFMPFLSTEFREKLLRRLKKDHVLVVHEDIRRISTGVDGLTRVNVDRPENQPKAKRRFFTVDLVLYSGGRDANSQGIGCDHAGVEIGKYGRIKVDDVYRTTNPAVFAIGDVLGPPGLASSAQQQARKVAAGLFRSRLEELRNQALEEMDGIEDYVDDDFFSEPDDGFDSPKEPEQAQQEGGNGMTTKSWGEMDAPLTLWTVPEIAAVGMYEEDARKEYGDDDAIVSGYAYFRDLARGRLSGDPDGFLKIVARAHAGLKGEHTILGVQIMGEGANELIQIGSILVHSSSTLEQVSNTPFAAVTLSGLYLMAADDALCRSPFNVLSSAKRKRGA